MDSKHHQILFGIADEPCSISDFLALMRPAGGSECCHFPPPAELEVFWYPFGAGAGEFSFPAPPSLSVQDQERVARFLHSLENSELSEYVGMINLVQFWAPITTGGGEIILSVSDQPFGVGRLSNGTCRYRFDCVRNLGGGGGDLIKSAFVTGLPQCSQLPLRGDEPQHRYGALSFWALPLVEPQTGSCDGVLEFVSTTAATFEIHRLFTQSFLNYGSKYYERFCENMAGTSFGNSGDLLLTSQQNISDFLPTPFSVLSEPVEPVLFTKLFQSMNHIDHELELAQIYEGNRDEICSAHVFLAHMPGPGEIKCHQDMSRPAANDELQVFWYPDSLPNRIQRKIKAFLLSLPESGYVGIFNLVQFWAPSGGGPATKSLTLSVSKEPFGVTQLSNGACRYRYFSVLNGDQVNESDPVGRAFLHQLPEFVVNVVEDYSQSQQSIYAKDCGFQTSWVIPLVRINASLLPVCVGVLEFLTRGDIRFDFTLLDKIRDYGQFCFQELSNHAILALNSPSEIETEHHMVPYVQGNQTHDHNSNLAHHFVTQATQHEASEDFVQYHQTPDDGFSPFPNHNYPQHGALASSPKTDHFLVGATEDIEQPLQVPTKQNMRTINASRYEITGNIIEELGSLVSAHDDDNIQDTAQTFMGTHTARIGKPKISMARIVEQFGKNIEDAAVALGVSKSTLKRNCRHYHILRWPSHKRNKVHPMNVKATCGASTVKFIIKSNIEINVLRRELGRRFDLEVGSFRIEYEDGDGGERITLPCTEDLNDHISTLKSSKEKTMHLIVSPST